MNTYEELLDEAAQNNVHVLENVSFHSQSNGLINGDVIGLSDCLKTTNEKACTLAEELGHYKKSNGNILDQSKTENCKQEKTARLWAFEKMITLDKLISAKKAGCHNRYEIAEYLNVTESFLQEALDSYRSKFGLGFQKGEYIIFFEPFDIYKMVENE